MDYYTVYNWHSYEVYVKTVKFTFTVSKSYTQGRHSYEDLQYTMKTEIIRDKSSMTSMMAMD